jgi:hypothetical protein
MFDDLIQRLTDHYARMAMNPATVEHARYMVRQHRDEPTGMFKDLPNLVKQRIEELKNEKEKQVQTQTDPS